MTGKRPSMGVAVLIVSVFAVWVCGVAEQKALAQSAGPSSSSSLLSDARAILNEFRARARIARGKSKSQGYLTLDLRQKDNVTDKAELVDLFEKVPADSDTFRLRSEVVVARRMPDWCGGVVYYVPSKDRYYVLREPGHPGTQKFYGPFKGKPWDPFVVAEPNHVSASNQFAIYLVTEPIVCERPQVVSLDAVRLDNKPIITEQDIVAYDWSKHSIQLKPGVLRRIPAPSSVIPFMVVADGRRCYIGTFLGLGFSSLPNMPFCYVGAPTSVLGGKDTLEIKGNPVSDVDVRSDIRIRQALVAAGLTRPVQTIEHNPEDAVVFNRLNSASDLSQLTPETPFGEAVEMFRNATRPPLKVVVLWRDLLDNADVDQQTPIQMEGVSETPLGTILSLMLQSVSNELAPIGYTVQDGVIVIGTKDSLPGSWETQVYDITDLMF